MSKNRFEKLEQNPAGKTLDPSSAGATSRRFRRWLEFKGEKRIELKLEPDKPKPAPAPAETPPAPSVHRPRPSPPARGGYSEEMLAAKRAARHARETELQAAQERARQARNRLLWIFGGLGGIAFLIYLLVKGGISGGFAELIFMMIAAIVVTIARGGRGNRRWWDDN